MFSDFVKNIFLRLLHKMSLFSTLICWGIRFGTLNGKYNSSVIHYKKFFLFSACNFSSLIFWDRVILINPYYVRTNPLEQRAWHLFDSFITMIFVSVFKKFDFCVIKKTLLCHFDINVTLSWFKNSYHALTFKLFRRGFATSYMYTICSLPQFTTNIWTCYFLIHHVI